MINRFKNFDLIKEEAAPRLPIKEEKSSRFSSPIVNKRKGLFDDDNVSRNLF